VEVDGVKVAPRKLLLHQIAKSLSTKGPDVILTLIEATGTDGKVSLQIIDKADEETGLSAMARGTLRQEESIPPEKFIENIRHCGIDISIE